MTDTPHLALPLLAAAQAQKHVTHNEALALLDALVHLAVKERDRTAPPGSPIEGDRYLVGPGATGAFAGQNGKLALFDLGSWRFLVPKPGWRALVEAENLIVAYDGSTWQPLVALLGPFQNLPRLGIGTTADATNRLAAKLNAALFTSLSAAEGGTGNCRFILNKDLAGGVLSQLYQTGYSSRAEAGLVGDDDFSIRVSPDGSSWREALRINRTTGAVSFPSGSAGLRETANFLINPEWTVNQRGFAGGVLPSGSVGFDRWRAGSGGAIVNRLADGTQTLQGSITQVIEAPSLAGRPVCVSVENLTASLTVNVGGASGTITAGSGRRFCLITVPAAATGDVAVTLSAPNLSFARPMVQTGTEPGPFERLPAGVTMALCQRYFAKTFPLATIPASNAGLSGALVSHAIVANAIPIVRWAFPAPMRAVPTLTFFNPTGSGATWSAGGVAAVASPTVAATRDAAYVGNTGTPSIAAGALTAIHATADAEL
jgi:hypothetical protein